MTEKLVIRLGSRPQDPIFWLVWSSQEQEIIASGELPDAEQLSTLADRAGGRPIVALAPSSELLLKTVSLPTRAGRKAIAAIPFMLEEELSLELDQQFFALGEKAGDQQQVMVVAKHTLDTWLAQMQEAGLVCEKLLPDVMALPVNPDGWTLMSLGEDMLIRQDDWQGLQGERQWILAAISHFAKQQTTPLALQHWEDNLNLPNVTETQLAAAMPIQTLAQGAMASKLNLLQGEYKPKKQGNNPWQQWRVAAILALVVIGTAILEKSLTLYQLKQERQSLSAQIESEFKRAFPETSRIVNVRSQMRQKLAALEQKGGATSMLAMMTQLQEAFANSRVKPQSIKFDSARSELRLQAVAENFQALEQFKQIAQASGFEVQQGAINNKDNQVIGALSIRS